jgi:hypothetical protein
MRDCVCLREGGVQVSRGGGGGGVTDGKAEGGEAREPRRDSRAAQACVDADAHNNNNAGTASRQTHKHAHRQPCCCAAAGAPSRRCAARCCCGGPAPRQLPFPPPPRSHRLPQPLPPPPLRPPPLLGRRWRRGGWAGEGPAGGRGAAGWHKHISISLQLLCSVPWAAPQTVGLAPAHSHAGKHARMDRAKGRSFLHPIPFATYVSNTG